MIFLIRVLYKNSDLGFGTSNIKNVGVRIFLTTDAFSRKTEPKGIKSASGRLQTGSHAQHWLRPLTPLGRCHFPYQVLHKIDDVWFEISQPRNLDSAFFEKCREPEHMTRNTQKDVLFFCRQRYRLIQCHLVGIQMSYDLNLADIWEEANTRSVSIVST